MPPAAPFDFSVAALRLVPVPAAALLINRSRREVMDLIDEGRLRWAFDIRTAGAGRGELRVLGQSLLEFSGLCPVAPTRGANEDEEFLRIANLILRPGIALKTAPAMARAGISTSGERVLRGTEVAHCFSCNSGHVRNLILEKSLQPVNLRREPNSTPLILRASVVHFLKARRVL